MFSQTAEYALRAIVRMACSEETAPTTAQLAEAAQIPKDYLAKVLRSLARAGLVQSQRGPTGGHRLARSPSDTTVLEVINAVDLIQRIERCPLGISDHASLCPLHQRLDAAIAMVEKAFADTTIAELLPNDCAGAELQKKALCEFPTVPGKDFDSSVPTGLDAKK